MKLLFVLVVVDTAVGALAVWHVVNLWNMVFP